MICRLLLGLMLVSNVIMSAADEYQSVPAYSGFHSVLPQGKAYRFDVPAFMMQRAPVTNQQFQSYVKTHPQWRRDEVASVMADASYLSHWSSALAVGSGQESQPVTRVSWMAAEAYCEAEGARLPRWVEWEVAAAADESHRDARDDPEWIKRIADWYSRPMSGPLQKVGQGRPNLYGLYDLHGLIWEMALDQSGLLVLGDSRTQGDAESSRFCGGGALSMDLKEHYEILMRIALLSSLEAADTSRGVGFRCAKDMPDVRR